MRHINLTIHPALYADVNAWTFTWRFFQFNDSNFYSTQYCINLEETLNFHVLLKPVVDGLIRIAVKLINEFQNLNKQRAVFFLIKRQRSRRALR